MTWIRTRTSNSSVLPKPFDKPLYHHCAISVSPDCQASYSAGFCLVERMRIELTADRLQSVLAPLEHASPIGYLKLLQIFQFTKFEECTVGYTARTFQNSTDGGIRTLTQLPPPQLLKLVCLPFHHIGILMFITVPHKHHPHIFPEYVIFAIYMSSLLSLADYLYHFGMKIYLLF